VKKKLELETKRLREKKEKEINRLIDNINSETESELSRLKNIEKTKIIDAKNFIERHLFD